jgi:hypothetical protein
MVSKGSLGSRSDQKYSVATRGVSRYFPWPETRIISTETDRHLTSSPTKHLVKVVCALTVVLRKNVVKRFPVEGKVKRVFELGWVCQQVATYTFTV